MRSELELRLEERFSDRFRRIWVQRTNFNSVCITLFPLSIGGNYRIITAERLPNRVDYDLVCRLIEKNVYL